jgi:hypothetical protein
MINLKKFNVIDNVDSSFKPEKASITDHLKWVSCCIIQCNLPFVPVVTFNPLTHCTFDVAHLTTEQWFAPPPHKDEIMQIKDDSEDVTGADL